MFRLSRLTAVLALSSLMLTSALPVFDSFGGSITLAEGKGGGKGGDKGGGGGNGGGNGGGGKSDKADKSDKGGQQEKPSKPGKTSKPKTTKKVVVEAPEPVAPKPKTKSKPKVKTTKPVTATKVPKPPKVADDSALPPAELGKMNGSLHASPNAILAHIRNGQLTDGPVALMAGLAVADAAAEKSLTNLRALEDLADAHGALTTGLTDAGYATVADYLAAKAAGSVAPETQTAIDGLIAGAGGLTADGTALSTTAPTDEELAIAYVEASNSAEGVASAEDALVTAWNKDGDPDDLLGLARERLATFADEIAAAVAEREAAAVPVETAPETPITKAVLEAG